MVGVDGREHQLRFLAPPLPLQREAQAEQQARVVRPCARPVRNAASAASYSPR